MTAHSYANMATGHATHKSGPQGAAVRAPSRAASSTLSTTSYSGAKAARTIKPSGGKSEKKK
jgi:hypothetical protein